MVVCGRPRVRGAVERTAARVVMRVRVVILRSGKTLEVDKSVDEMGQMMAAQEDLTALLWLTFNLLSLCTGR